VLKNTLGGGQARPRCRKTRGEGGGHVLGAEKCVGRGLGTSCVPEMGYKKPCCSQWEAGSGRLCSCVAVLAV
jgi:hypothetical protein